jgi:hypothetical protein
MSRRGRPRPAARTGARWLLVIGLFILADLTAQGPGPMAGPASLSAGSSIPGQIWLTFPWVPGAQRYRVTRTSDLPETERAIYEGEAGAFGTDAPGGAFHDAPVRPGFTYSYRVHAILRSHAGTTVSAPSPAATARSAPFVQPTSLKGSVGRSPVPGMADLTLTWSPVPNAEQYRVTINGRSQPYEISGTSLLVSGIASGRRYRVCVGTVYPYGVSDDVSATCTIVKT